MTKELVEVVQADRDAAAELFLADGGKIVRAMNARLGSFDEGPSVQAFARHRLSAEAAIVAWLREEVATIKPVTVIGDDDSIYLTDEQEGEKRAFLYIADALEQGKHHG